MEFMKYIGFQLNEARQALDASCVHYEVIETFDTKHTIVGEECRIVNIKTEDADGIVRIYVAYF